MLTLFTFCLLQVSSDVRIVGDGAVKVSQVTGETDREKSRPTDNRTESRLGLRGTDLGISIEHRGRLAILFGDTWPTGPNTADRPVDGDAIAFSDDKNPDDGLDLHFFCASDKKYLTMKIPGVSLQGFEVPTGGFSDGSSMFGYFSTDARKSKKGMVMGRSVLAESKDGIDWKLLYSWSTDKFINCSPVVVDAATTPGLPITKGKGVLLWASGTQYRRSSVHLAFVPLGKVRDKTAIRYWVSSGKWSQSEAEASPVVIDPQVGELSVAWSKSLGQWLMLYNSGSPRGIVMRTSLKPEVPWSKPRVLFDPKRGYGKFMHIANKADGLSDPNRIAEWGGEYGPYMIPRFFKGDAKETTIYFLMSTWNPYNVVLMKACLSVSK